jgi:ABC-type transport system involved in multi-copper enzyme maturation permease subunit
MLTSNPWGLALLAGLVLITLAVLSRRGVLRLVGPVFAYDLVRTARRGRLFAFRTLYLLAMLLVLLYVWALWADASSRGPITGSAIRDQARLTEVLAVTLMAAQLVVAVLATPALSAGAIAEEKERRTMELLLATDLSAAEIVIGKTGARLGRMAEFLLAGLPILSALQFLGGVPPELVLMGVAACLLTTAGLAGVGAFVSATLRRPRDAVAVTYLVMLGYVGLSVVALFLKGTAMFNWRLPVGFGRGVYGNDLLDAFAAGNPILVAVALGRSAAAGNLAGALPIMMRDYALFHGLLAVVGVALAVWRLRPVALTQSEGPRRGRARRAPTRPAIGNAPMVWKELFIGSGWRPGLWLKLILVLLVLLSFTPPVLITAHHAPQLMTSDPFAKPDNRGGPWGWSNDPWVRYRSDMNGWARTMAVMIGSLTLLLVAVRAAGSVTGERAAHTLDELLTTPMGAAEILMPKWLGALWAVRKLLLWQGAVFLIAVLVGAVHPVGVALFAAAWLVYAAPLASLGLYFSATNRSSMRATLSTLLLAVLAMGGHWIIFMMGCMMPLMLAASRPPEVLQWVAAFEAGSTPPFVFGFVPFSGFDEFNNYRDQDWAHVVCGAFGLVPWLIATPILLSLAHALFAARTGRYNRGPERSPPGLFPYPPKPKPAVLSPDAPPS